MMAFAYDNLVVRRRSPPQMSGTEQRTYNVTAGSSFGGFHTAAGGGTVIYQEFEIESANMPVVRIVPVTVTFTVAPATPEPVVRNTDISIYRIAALCDGGMSVAEIMIDFPELSKAQIEDAIQQAKTTPYYGKPYPRKTLKHFLRKGSFGRLKRELAEIGADE